MYYCIVYIKERISYLLKTVGLVSRRKLAILLSQQEPCLTLCVIIITGMKGPDAHTYCQCVMLCYDGDENNNNIYGGDDEKNMYANEMFPMELTGIWHVCNVIFLHVMI